MYVYIPLSNIKPRFSYDICIDNYEENGLSQKKKSKLKFFHIAFYGSKFQYSEGIFLKCELIIYFNYKTLFCYFFSLKKSLQTKNLREIHHIIYYTLFKNDLWS